MTPDDSPALETFNQFVDANKAARKYPDTLPTIRHLHRHSEALGLLPAFIRIGQRILVDRATFYRLIVKRSREVA